MPRTLGAIAICYCVLISCTAPQPTTVSDGADARRCISLASVSGRYALGSNAIMFETLGAVNYRNDLASRCPPLERLGSSASMAFDHLTNAQLCAGDRVRFYDARDATGLDLSTTPPCLLGHFMPVQR